MNELETAAGLAPTAGYFYARRLGDRLFVAGQVPLDGSGELVGRGDARAQAEQCLDNLETILGVHGFAGTDVRQLVVHVVGEHQNLLDAWAAVTARFPDGVPPATLLGVPILGHAEQLVEIDATVMKG